MSKQQSLEMAANRKFNRWLAERGLLASAVPPEDGIEEVS